MEILEIILLVTECILNLSIAALAATVGLILLAPARDDHGENE